MPRSRREISVGRLAQSLGLELIGDPATVVGSVAEDNRHVVAGDVFVAIAGATTHGARFAADAVARGARAVLTDPAGALLVAQAGLQVPVLVAEQPRRTAGPLAALVYGEPADRLTTFAVTGTNGKTTTTYLIEHALRSLGLRTGLIGTVESRYGDRTVASRLTTPEASELQEWLAAMAEDGVGALAMEVSSHSIAMHRVDGVVFDVVGFTNLSQDHLDFHGDLESYFAVKAQLFTPERARRGVVVIDDAWGDRLADLASVPVATLRTAPSGLDVAGRRPDWTVTDVVPAPGGTAFTLAHRDGRALRTSVRLPGPFNVANAALALAMVLESGVDVDALESALGQGLDPVVPGRMETVSDAPRVVVDFAHNADALELALAALRATTQGRLIVVFGATGDRDRGKRPVMGTVAVAGADVVVVTDDDPHSEDPAAIRAAVLSGARAAADARATQGNPVEVREVAPRARAIRETVGTASARDTVLVAGRGHETIQEVAGVDLPLDDRVEARAALRGRDQDVGAMDTAEDRPEHEPSRERRAPTI